MDTKTSIGTGKLQPIMQDPDELDRIVETSIDMKIHRNLERWIDNPSRRVYTLFFGEEKRIVKIDQKVLKKGKAEFHKQRGTGTGNEIDILLKIPKPEEHYLIRLISYHPETKVSMESYFESRSLRQRVENGESYDQESFEKIFSQVLEAERYLIKDCNLLHRDLNSGNILINESLDVRITDLANAKEIPKIKESVMPTAGGSWIQDPIIIGNWEKGKKKEKKYSEKSEMYAIGMNMYASITGKRAFRYDEHNCIAEDMFGNSMLSRQKKFSPVKHNRSLEKALKELPNWANNGLFNNGYESIIRKCLTADTKERFENIEELVKEFITVRAGNFFKRKKKQIISGVLSAVLSLSLGTLAYQEATKPAGPVISPVAQVNGEVTNPGFIIEELRLEDLNTEKIFSDFSKRLKVKKGSALIIKGISTVLPPVDPSNAEKMKIEAYLEGYPPFEPELIPGEVFTPYTHSIIDNKYHFSRLVAFPLENKNHTVIIDMYTPGTVKGLEMPPQGTVIYRKRIPIIVGDPDCELNTLMMTKNGIIMPLFSPDPNIVIYVPENKTKQSSNTWSPTIVGVGDKTLYYVAEKDRKIQAEYFFPITSKNTNGEYTFSPRVPYKDDPAQIIRYRTMRENGSFENFKEIGFSHALESITRASEELDEINKLTSEILDKVYNPRSSRGDGVSENQLKNFFDKEMANNLKGMNSKF